MKKVGIIRCKHTEDNCPGTTDFKIASEGKLAFEATGPVEVIGFVSCGGCPGKKAVSRSKTLVEKGADIIVLGSCISKGFQIGEPCPHYRDIKNAISMRIGAGKKIIEYTH
jgi:predicted metal-binding protein